MFTGVHLLLFQNVTVNLVIILVKPSQLTCTVALALRGAVMCNLLLTKYLASNVGNAEIIT